MSSFDDKAVLDVCQQEHLYQQTNILEDATNPINAQVSTRIDDMQFHGVCHF